MDEQEDGAVEEWSYQELPPSSNGDNDNEFNPSKEAIPPEGNPDVALPEIDEDNTSRRRLDATTRARKPCCMVGLRKLWILLWKNFLLRKRSWILLILQVLSIVGVFFLLKSAGPPSSSGATQGPVPANETTSRTIMENFQSAFNSSKILFVSHNQRGKEIIDRIVGNPGLQQPAIQGYTIPVLEEVADETEVEKAFSDSVFSQQGGASFKAAVIFTKVEDSGVAYKIRMSDNPRSSHPGESVGSTVVFSTGTLFNPQRTLSEGPGPQGDQSYMAQYAQSGFLGLQILIDDAAIREFHMNARDQAITLKSFPYPKYRRSSGEQSVTVFGLLFTLVYIMANAFFAKNVGSEKETGVKELMKLCGYPGWMQTIAWYLIAFLVDLILFAVFLLLLKTVTAGTGPEARPFFGNSDFLLLLFIMLLVMISNNAFVFFISSLTKSTALATAVAILLPIGLVLGGNFAHFNTSVAILGYSVLPHGCFIAALQIIMEFEAEGKGIHWSMIADEMPSIPKLSLGLVILMFLVDIVLYQTLAVYFEAILPSEYGVQKQPHYPFLALIDAVKPRKSKFKDNDVPSNDTAHPTESKAAGFEPPPEVDKPVGVDVRKLVKKFGKNKTAVNGVSLKMYDGEIFALLGHNGAGKTTLISMLTGLFAPTSGTAVICGYDVRTDLDKVRQSLGLCPQHDMLFNNLTVMEHLKIFGQMKGQKSSEVKQEALALLQMMNLADKQNVVSKKLSGGQKRKLCLGMALIGGAKVVILDEPTSGMDPEARRAIWDILLQVRGQRTILLTTHFMEEADALGERIGIMAAGQLQCCGTPAFLKSYYGTGYTLKMALLPGADKYAILALVQKHISSATMKPINMPNEVFISLPTDATGASALTSLFSALTGKKKEMCIESLGLSVASMDEIFVKVGELSEKAAVEPKDAPHQQQHEPTQSLKSMPSLRTTRHDPSSRSQSQSQVPLESAPATISHGQVGRRQDRRSLIGVVLALIVKRFICTKRKPFFLLFQILIPVTLTMSLVFVVNDAIKLGSLPPSLTLRLGDYKNSRTLYRSDVPSQISHAKEAIVHLGSVPKPSANIEDDLWNAGKSNLVFFREKMIVAGEISVSGDEFTAWYNQVPMHAAPLAINLASNIRARQLSSNNPSPFTIQVTNHPLQTLEALNLQMVMELNGGGAVSVFGFVALPFLALLFISPFFVILPTEERLNKSRQLQLMTGLHPLIYWMVYFLWDLLILVISATVSVVLILILEHGKVFSSHHGIGVIFLVILCYGFAIIPFAYLVSGVPKSVAGAVIILIMFLSVPTIIAFFLAMSPKTQSIGLLLHDILSAAGARYAFANIALTLQKNARCNFLGDPEITLVCQAPAPVGEQKLRLLQACCKNCTSLSAPCFQPDSYLTWTFDPRGKEPGNAQLLLGMIVVSLICLILHISSELGIGRWIRSLLLARATNTSDFLEPVDDEDVRVEEERVAEMIGTRTTSTDALVVDTLCKNFGGFSAVSRLTFGVHHGECFGLLGTNGAGKTTTFRMLTGDELPSLGNVHQERFTLKGNRRTFISHVGYCPQFDATVPYFTGKENLQLFARLRGVPWRRVNEEAEKLLESVGLTSSQHVQSRRYSGGMRRRLSAAVAIIGGPALVLLDEPTSGVDPVSRRQFWKVVEAVKGSGQSIILTSHSMNECEALCARLGIMVNGQLQCIGGVQHLKHKFAQGYTLTLRLKTIADSEKQEYVGGLMEALNNEITQKFHPCVLKDQHETVMQYQIENANLDWNVIYKNLEDLKKSYGDIVEDYSVSETSLEEVFLAFSRKQYPPRVNKIPLWKRVLTCQY